MANAEPQSPEFAVFWTAHFFTAFVTGKVLEGFAPVRCVTEPKLELQIYSDHNGKEFSVEEMAGTANAFNDLLAKGEALGVLPEGCERLDPQNTLSHREKFAANYGADGNYVFPLKANKKIDDETRKIYQESFAQAAKVETPAGIEFGFQFARGNSPYGDEKVNFFRINVKGVVTPDNVADVILSLVGVARNVTAVELPNAPELVFWPKLSLTLAPEMVPEPGAEHWQP